MSRSTIGIPESYFDYLNFTTDKDLSRHVWLLTDDKEIVFGIAQPLISKHHMEQKQALQVKHLK